MQQAQTQQQTQDAATLTPLENFYLGIIAATAESEKLNAILQHGIAGAARADGCGAGRIYLCRSGTTKPDAVVQFEFQDSVVKLGIQHTNGTGFAESYPYAGGIDAFLPEMVKVLQAGLLPSSVKARKAENMGGLAARRPVDATVWATKAKA